MYWKQTKEQLETVESHMDQNGYLVCNTDHFSAWSVAEVSDTTEPTSDTPQGGAPLEYLAIGAAAVIVIVVIAAGVLEYGKRK